jgi:ubiquinone biosynthesis protein
MELGGRLSDETGEKDVRGPIRRMLSDKYAHYKRVGEILAALSRYGFGRAWDSASVLKDLPFDSEARKEVMDLRTPVRFRQFLEGLGPAFIKLGQLLSTRPDLIAEEYADELANLRDNVPPVPFEVIKETVESELEGKLEGIFSSFEQKPVAAASIGQVHRAILKGTGQKVAVKVQRPDVAGTVRADIEILKDIVGVLERSFSSIDRFNARGVVEEFERMLLREIDYTIEARNIRRFTENFEDMPEVSFPVVHWKQSSRRVLTMDFIDGFTIDKKEELGKLKLDPAKLTATLGRAYIKMIFLDGFFHADPHQGNIFVLKDGRVCFLDFGAIGYLDDDMRAKATMFYMSLIRQDAAKAAGLLMQLSGATERTVDIHNLEWDLRDFLDFSVLSSQKVHLSRGMNQRIATISMKHGVMLPSSFVLMERALAEIEGVCRTLDPEFDITILARNNLDVMLKARYTPELDPLQAIETARSYRELVRDLPGRLDRLLKKLETDDFRVKVDGSLFDDIKKNIRRMGLIIAVTIMAASLVIYMGWEGQGLNLQFVHVTIGVLAIVFAWVLAVAVIYRRG